VPALALLTHVAERQAALVAQWMGVGFIHGVMNTDNMALAGETIDYGPCAFMDVFESGAVFSSIDHGGRYAYDNQPAIAQWNLTRFAETLLPLIDSDRARAVDAANAVLGAFPAVFHDAWLGVMRRKLGLMTAAEDDAALIASLLTLLERAALDMTTSFRALSEGRALAVGDAHATPAADFDSSWRTRLAAERTSIDDAQRAMRAVNPVVIPRNHHVEHALVQANAGDLAPFAALLAAVRRPFAPSPEDAPFAVPPRPEQRVTATFCGT
jgi:uncharacterized protein YdiU (UPF0061 family)